MYVVAVIRLSNVWGDCGGGEGGSIVPVTEVKIKNIHFI
tara:strand:+ start:239 stop:355 length:117 start_codon:yes stop_codon:yes gene_type:complete